MMKLILEIVLKMKHLVSTKDQIVYSSVCDLSQSLSSFFPRAKVAIGNMQMSECSRERFFPRKQPEVVVV